MVAVPENRLQNQHDDVINVTYVHPTWNLGEVAAQDFGEFKRLFGEELDVFLTKDGLKFERGDLDELKRIEESLNKKQ